MLTMSRPTRLWVAAVVLMALAASALATAHARVTANDALVLLLLGTSGALAHLFPIRSRLGGASHRLTNVSLVAGAILLPSALLLPLALGSLLPDRLVRRRGSLTGLAFNVAQSVLAAQVAGCAAALTTSQLAAPQFQPVRVVLPLLAASAAFLATQEGLVAVVIALQSRIPVRRADNLATPALLSTAVVDLLGAIAAGIWLQAPGLLLLVVPLLVIIQQVIRGAYLSHLAQLDPKTGLYNSRLLEDALDQEMARAVHERRPLALLFMDLDYFKRINDRYGHAAGDRVLLQVAEVLRSSARRGDILARFGGEEFVAVLPGASVEQAIAMAERLRQLIEDHAFVLDGDMRLHCTASIGVAVAMDDARDAVSLLRQADAAMYEAKRTRNAVARPPLATLDLPAIEPAHTTEPDAAAAEAAANLGAAATGAGKPLPHPAAPLVLAAIITLGGVCIAWSLVGTVLRGQAQLLVPLGALAVAAEALYVRVYDRGEERISLSLTPVVGMAAVVLAPMTAPSVYALAAVGHVCFSRQKSVSKALFNIANPALAIAAAGLVYHGLSVLDGHATFDWLSAAEALLAMLCFYAVNSGLLAVVIGLHTRQRMLVVLRETSWYAPTKLMLGMTGAFLGGALGILGPLGVAMFAVPVLILRFTLAYYARQAQATIETLRTLNQRLEREIDQRKRFQNTLAFQELHDGLTGLGNRGALGVALHEQLVGEQVPRPSLALLVMDLDRFKDVNDTFGHEFGDRLLVDVARRLARVVDAPHMLARLGGDEFGVLLVGVGPKAAEFWADRLRQAFDEPVVLDGYTLSVGASLGIALSPEHGGEPDVLLRRAEIAMYHAKGTGSGISVYDPATDTYNPERLALLSELRTAIEADELMLYYQPKVAPGSHRLESVEALLRWRHPTRGFVPPDQFIPLAEQSGLIDPLTRWVVRAALRQCRAWLDDGQPVPIAVNLSMRNLHNSRLPAEMASLLAESGVPAALLHVEVTESAVMADPARAVDVLEQLRALGLHVSVDDFGSGYSSLGYLRQLPVDELKIDKAFVLKMASEPKDAAIVRAAVDLAHSLGLTVVAEGVEDADTVDLLRLLDCDLIQGYHISPPVPAGKLFERVAPPRALIAQVA